jgi:hypothetical protein
LNGKIFFVIMYVDYLSTIVKWTGVELTIYYNITSVLPCELLVPDKGNIVYKISKVTGL